MKARIVREDVHRNKRNTNIKYWRFYALIQKNNVMLRSIQETIRIIDTKEVERQYGQKKLKYKYEFTNTEARYVFKSNNIVLSITKHAHGYNHFGLRNTLINRDIVEACYPRYNSVEI